MGVFHIHPRLPSSPLPLLLLCTPVSPSPNSWEFLTPSNTFLLLSSPLFLVSFLQAQFPPNDACILTNPALSAYPRSFSCLPPGISRAKAENEVERPSSLARPREPSQNRAGVYLLPRISCCSAHPAFQQFNIAFSQFPPSDLFPRHRAAARCSEGPNLPDNTHSFLKLHGQPFSRESPSDDEAPRKQPSSHRPCNWHLPACPILWRKAATSATLHQSRFRCWSSIPSQSQHLKSSEFRHPSTRSARRRTVSPPPDPADQDPPSPAASGLA